MIAMGVPRICGVEDGLQTKFYRGHRWNMVPHDLLLKKGVCCLITSYLRYVIDAYKVIRKPNSIGPHCRIMCC